MNIDALVARDVMGWKWWSACGKSHLCPPWAEHSAGFMPGLHFGPGKEFDEAPIEVYYSRYRNMAVPAYSTDPAAMMVVKARLLEIDREKYGGMTSLYSTWNPYECQWEVKIDWSDNTRFEAKHENECVAWCLLGLAVVGTPEDEITKALEER